MRRLLNNIRNHRNWLDYLLFKIFNTSAPSFTFKHRTGLIINVPRRLLQTYKECFFDEGYVKGFPKNPGLLGTPVIIDIGANVGYFSLFMFAKNKDAKLYAYEPIPKNFELLNTYRKENKALSFQIFNVAVSANVGSISLTYDNQDSFTTSASIFSRNENTEQIDVDSVTLESIMQSNHLDRVDLLKLDCEGSEYDILYNTSSSVFNQINHITLEAHTGDRENENVIALVKFLSGEGFKCNVKLQLVWAWKD